MKRFVMAFILLVALLLHMDSGYSAKIATLEKREFDSMSVDSVETALTKIDSIGIGKFPELINSDGFNSNLKKARCYLYTKKEVNTKSLYSTRKHSMCRYLNSPV